MANRINKSVYNFFLCFEYILKNREFNIDDILFFIANHHHIFLYKETILKYIRTFKELGFEFERLNNKTYKLTRIPFNIFDNKEEIKTAFKCLKILNQYLVVNNLYKKMFFQKTALFSQKDFMKLFESTQKDKDYKANKYSLLKEYCSNAQRLEISYLENKKNIKIIVEPINIYLTEKEEFLEVYKIAQNEVGLINFNDILEIIQLPMKNKFSFKKHSAILKFTSKFAKAYSLKEGEEKIKVERNELYVKSFYSDKQMFFKRILRYMENCEIVEPKALREEFLQYLDDLYQIYDCI